MFSVSREECTFLIRMFDLIEYRLEEQSFLDVKHALLHCKVVRVDNTLS